MEEEPSTTTPIMMSRGREGDGVAEAGLVRKLQKGWRGRRNQSDGSFVGAVSPATVTQPIGTPLMPPSRPSRCPFPSFPALCQLQPVLQGRCGGHFAERCASPSHSGATQHHQPATPLRSASHPARGHAETSQERLLQPSMMTGRGRGRGRLLHCEERISLPKRRPNQRNGIQDDHGLIANLSECLAGPVDIGGCPF